MRFIERLFGPPSLKRFAARLMQALRDAGETSQLQYDAAEHRILLLRDRAEPAVVNLDNMYQTYVQQPRAERATYLRSLVRGVLTHQKELPDEFDAARHDLRPKLWARAGLEQERLRSLAGKPNRSLANPLCETIGEHLLLFVAYDWPEATQSLSAEHLEGWDVTFYQAMEVARQDLEEATQGYAQIGEGKHLYAFVSGDSYDAARLTLIDRIRDLDVVGKHVAMVPNRDSLVITGSEDPVGLQMMADVAGKALEENYVLSGIALILDEGAWVDWMPPADHPLHRRFRDLELMWIGPLYEEQKKLLDAVHERQGIDIHVGSFSAVQKKTGEQVSYCIWGRGADSLLPVTQKVAFMQEGHKGPIALGDWARVLEIAGDLMELTEHYPRRYRVREFPNATALEAIGLAEM
jgi:hypothetical protein